MPHAPTLDDLYRSNPWREVVRRGWYVHPDDESAIVAFNKHADDDHKICLGVLPEPFLGSPEAPIWLLNLNPGLDPRDLNHSDEVKAAQRRNLCLESDHFWYLDNSYHETPGHLWWQKRLRVLIENVGSADTVSKNLFCLEFFPYHSVQYKQLVALPSQQFTWDLLRAAIRAKKRLILMRGINRWKKPVPELETFDYERLKNPRCAYVSEKNFEHFIELCSRLRDLGRIGVI